MERINFYGIIFIAVIMVPNIIYAIKCKEGFENRWNNKIVEIIEQIGRFGCIGFMIIKIPVVCFGWWFDGGIIAYLAINIVLSIIYCVIWIICFRKDSIFRALSLSIIPSLIFICSAVLSGSILLLITSALFAPAHILISYKNAKK